MSCGACIVHRAAGRRAHAAGRACLIPIPVNLNMEAAEMVAKIQGNFEEWGV